MTESENPAEVASRAVDTILDLVENAPYGNISLLEEIEREIKKALNQIAALQEKGLRELVGISQEMGFYDSNTKGK